MTSRLSRRCPSPPVAVSCMMSDRLLRRYAIRQTCSLRRNSAGGLHLPRAMANVRTAMAPRLLRATFAEVRPAHASPPCVRILTGFAARKTRCDGGHPSCSSCARRSLPCNYVNDPANGNVRGRPKTAGAVSAGPSAPPSSRSSPTAQPGPLAGIPNGYLHHIHTGAEGLEVELKRNLDLDSVPPPAKKMRITDDLPPPQPVAVSQAN